MGGKRRNIAIQLVLQHCCMTSIGVRAGGARGAAAPPPKVWATQIFWAARENLGKASF